MKIFIFTHTNTWHIVTNANQLQMMLWFLIRNLAKDETFPSNS